MKKNINILIVFVFIFLGFVIHVDAANINDLSSGDIVIGNTRFKSGTWVSASRAAKAGSLYTIATGKTDANTYLYINPYVIYIYDDTIENYKLLNSNEIVNLEMEMNIYYENNEPLINTYESYSLIEDDELLEANDVYMFYNEMYGEIFLEDETDENVKLDYENETITCPYHYVFNFQVVANNEPVNFIGICGVDDFRFELEDNYNQEKIEIESIELVDGIEEPDLLNQSKVDFEHYDSLNNYVTINDKLEEYLPNLAGKSGAYVAFDINISGNSSYRIVERNFSDKNFSIIGYDDHIRLYLEFDNYYNGPYSFILLDEEFGTYEEVYFYIDGLERPTYDLTIENVEKTSSLLVSNNSMIHSIDSDNEIRDELEYNSLIINTIGELTSIECNNLTGKYIAIDLTLNDEVDYDFIEVNSNEMNSYEIIDNKIRLYLRSNGFVGIVDKITNSSLRFDVILNNFDEEKYISYNNGFSGEYYITGTTELGEYSIEKANNNYNMSLLYDAENSKLYYKNTINTLFMDNDSIKMITTQINNDVEEVIVKDVDLFIYFTDGTENYYWSPSNISETTLYELVSNEINNSEKELKAVIQTFFKPGRVLTETEQAEFDKFDELVETGKVEIVDISSSIYE